MKGCRFYAFLIVVTTFSLLSSSWAETVNQTGEFFKAFAKPNNFHISGNGIVETKDGYLVVGDIFDESGPSNWGWAVKVDKNGKKQWEKELGKEIGNSAFYQAALTGDNGIVLAGSISAIPPGIERASGWLVKLMPNGKVEWDKALRFERNTLALDITSKGNDVIVVGGIRQGTRESPSIQDSAFITELDSKGNILWTKHIQKRYWGNEVYLLKKGGFIIRSGQLIAKLDDMGNVLWEYSLNKKEYKLSASITELKDGSIYLFVAGEPKDKKTPYISLIKLNADGTLIWDKRIESIGLCKVASLWTTEANEIVAVGGTCANEKERMWASIFTPSGEMKLIKKYLTDKDLKINQAIPVDDGFIAVGSGAEQKEGGSAAWIFKTKFNITKNK